MSISELILENEKIFKSKESIENDLLEIWQVMKECVQNGLKADGTLRGGLNVPKRAFKSLY